MQNHQFSTPLRAHRQSHHHHLPPQNVNLKSSFHACSTRTTRPSSSTFFQALDILLREQLDAIKGKHPNRFDVAFVIDKSSEKWTGTILGHVFAPLIPRCRSHGVHWYRSDQAASCTTVSRTEDQVVRLWYEAISFPRLYPRICRHVFICCTFRN